MLNFISNIFGSSNDRILKKMMVHVNAANELEEELSSKPDSFFIDLKDLIDPQDPANNCLDVAIITAPEKRTQKTIDKLKTVAGRVLIK